MPVTRRPWGHVEQLPSGSIRATHPGPDKRRVGQTFTTQELAESWLASQRTALGAGTFVDPQDGSIELEAYFEQDFLPGRALRPKTVESYTWLFQHYLADDLGRQSIAAIRPAEVRRWHRGLADRLPGQAAKAYRLLSAIMNQSVADELTQRSPCRVAGAGQESSPERPVASVAEATALTAAMPERMRIVVLLAAWCQLRRGEILALRRRDLDLLRGQIRVEHSVTYLNDGRILYGPPKTAAGRRTVTVPGNVVDDLRRHLDRFVGPRPDDLVVTGAKGGPLRPHVLQKAWAKARLSVGRPDLHLHDLRHSGLTWSAATGATLAELMRRAGHSKPDAAIRYQHATDDRDRALADALSGLAIDADVVPIRRNA